MYNVKRSQFKKVLLLRAVYFRGQLDIVHECRNRHQTSIKIFSFIHRSIDENYFSIYECIYWKIGCVKRSLLWAFQETALRYECDCENKTIHAQKNI